MISTRMTTISTFILDDHKIVRDGLQAMFINTNIKVTGMFGNATQLYEGLKKESPDIIILDLSLPGASGLEVARTLNRHHKGIKVIVLTANTTEHNFISAVKVGVKAFLDKNCSKEELLEAIHEVYSGGVYFGKGSSYTIYKSIQKMTETTSNDELTEREIEVLRCFAQGLSYKETAEKLSITVKTVETHRKNIFDKQGFTSQVDLVKYAIREGLVGL